MGKKKKKEKKRAERRERAKTREEVGSPEEQIEAQEQAADEAVEQAVKAEPVTPPARERKIPKAPREDDRDNAWERLKLFLREVDIERKKINWPAIDETWRSTWVTVVVILFLSGFMGLASWGFSRVSENLFGLGTAVAPAPGNVPTTPLGGALTTQPPAETEESPAETGGTETPSGE